MEILLFIILFVLCFFLLYIFSKHDFVLLRQNISLSQIFDAASVSLVSAFIFGRVLYVVNNFKSELLSVLRFFHIVKYPGISMFGFMAGAALCFYLIFMKKKGIGRIGDIFAVSFYPLFAFGILFEGSIKPSILPILFFIFSIPYYIFLIRCHQKYVLRDGNVSFLFFLILCVQTFLFQYFSVSKNAIFSSFTLLEIISAVAIPAVLVGFVRIQSRKKA